MVRLKVPVHRQKKLSSCRCLTFKHSIWKAPVVQLWWLSGRSRSLGTLRSEDLYCPYAKQNSPNVTDRCRLEQRPPHRPQPWMILHTTHAPSKRRAAT